MASTLCLGPDHRPQSQASPRIYRERKARLDDNSFFNLFGAGESFTVKGERSRTRRPLPVNTLTGDIIGCYSVGKLSTPAQSPVRGEDLALSRRVVTNVLLSGRRPPGGAHCPLWWAKQTPAGSHFGQKWDLSSDLHWKVDRSLPTIGRDLYWPLQSCIENCFVV